jgi:hypothetical protein
LCAVVVSDPELDLCEPVVFRHDSVEIAVISGLPPDRALLLVQALLLTVGVEQDDDGQAVCWCGEVLAMPVR